MTITGRILGLAALAVLLTCPVFGGGEREPVVAGQFYPQDAASLHGMVQQCLREAAARPMPLTAPASAQFVGLIVPHAGYVYSGRIAAVGFHAVASQSFERIYLLGVDHHSARETVSVWADGAFVTPIGRLPVDTAAARELLDPAAGIVDDATQHNAEHSLEVQVPFMLASLGPQPFVPVAAGGRLENGPMLGRRLAAAIARSGKRTLVIASTDWSHYHDAKTAATMDGAARERVLALDSAGLLAGLRQGTMELCGINGVTALLEVARNLGARPTMLAAGDSGNVSGDTDRVVGYAAILFTATATTPAGTGTTRVAATTTAEVKAVNPFHAEAMAAVNATLDAVLAGKSAPTISYRDPRFSEKRGVFVTLKKHGELRGCIGLIEGIRPLGEAIVQMAEAAALEDPRFSPVTASERKDLQIEISILTPLTKVASLSEIQIGTHGLLLRHRGHSGVFLPQVPVEWKWDLDTYLEQLCYKAGLPKGSHTQGELFKFSAEVFGDHE